MSIGSFFGCLGLGVCTCFPSLSLAGAVRFVGRGFFTGADALGEAFIAIVSELRQDSSHS